MREREVKEMDKKKGKPEAEVLKECLSVLRELGIFCWRQNTGAFKTQNGGFFRSSMAGVSDIIGLLPTGRFFCVECKREKGGVVSEAQKTFLERVDSNNGIAIVCNDAEKLREILMETMREEEE